MIEVEQLRKNFNNKLGLNGFSLRVEKGELFGLVGPNGAGKTTLIRVLATLLMPDSGSARIGEADVTSHPDEVKRIVGYMPDQPGLYQDMRVREFLEFFSDAFRIPRQQRNSVVEKALDRSGLGARSQTFVEELSFGLKQRLFLAKTLLHNPKVLLLDEPATGLDPMARIALRNELKQLNREGITILISSHILNDLEDICDRVAFIAEGSNAKDDRGQSIIELRRSAPSVLSYEIQVLGDTIAAVDVVKSLSGITVLETENAKIVVEIPGSAAEAAQFLRRLTASGVDVVKFDRAVETLEMKYRNVFGDKSQ